MDDDKRERGKGVKWKEAGDRGDGFIVAEMLVVVKIMAETTRVGTLLPLKKLQPRTKILNYFF